MADIRTQMAATRQVLNQVRAAVVAEAQEIADRAGSRAILVSRLADKHGVAALTAKRWLQAAGFELKMDRRGRPSFEEVLLHDGLMDVLNKFRARDPE